MLENYTAAGMKAKENLFFNEIFNSEWNLKITWNMIPENFSLGFPVTKEIPNPKNTRQTKNLPKAALSSQKQIFALHQKERSLKRWWSKRRKTVPTTAKYGVLHFSVMKKQLMDKTVITPSSQLPYNTQNSFITVYYTDLQKTTLLRLCNITEWQ